MTISEDRLSEPSVNSKVRLLGEVGTSDKPSFPMPARAPAQSAAPPVSITPPPPIPVQAEPIFLGDAADGADLLNSGQIVQPLAQLCVTPQIQTPFLAAILGPSGAGKTFAVRRLAQTLEQLSASSAASGNALARVVLARVDASSGVEAPVAIASAAYGRKPSIRWEPGGVDYSGLLDEIRGMPAVIRIAPPEQRPFDAMCRALRKTRSVKNTTNGYYVPAFHRVRVRSSASAASKCFFG